jgi:phosphohistidine phosphatase
MVVYVIRHADAGTSDPNKYPDDSLRPLSAKGKIDMLRIARGMRRLGIEFDEILDSGFTRARQTSECVCDVYEIDAARIRTVQELSPDTEPATTAAALRKLRGPKSIAVVGHQPHLGRLIGFMVASTTELSLEFKKGGVCRIDVSRWSKGGASLVSALPPRVLRKIGK